MFCQYKSSMTNVLINCIYPEKVSIIHGFAVSVYAVLIDFNEIKSWKVIQQVKSFYRNAKVLLSVDFLLVNVVRGIKCLENLNDSSCVFRESAVHNHLCLPHCTFICIFIKHPQSCYHSFVICLYKEICLSLMYKKIYIGVVHFNMIR